MSFDHECNKNNKYDINRHELAWHNKILTNPLQLIYLFVNVSIRGFLEVEKLGEPAKPYAMERVAGQFLLFHYYDIIEYFSRSVN